MKIAFSPSQIVRVPEPTIVAVEVALPLKTVTGNGVINTLKELDSLSQKTPLNSLRVIR